MSTAGRDHGARRRHGDSSTVAIMRLATVPLVLVAGVNADEDVVGTTGYLVLAAALQVYAIAVWVGVRRSVPLPVRPVLAADVAGIVALALAADLSSSATARFGPFILVATWAFILPRRLVLPWTVGFVTVLVVGQAVVHGSAGLGRVAIGLALLVGLAAIVARFVEGRRAQIAELESRAAEFRGAARGLERRERARIAQLLHDDALQRLLAARQELDHGVEVSDPAALHRAAEGMREATVALRGLTLAIDDAELEAAGLDAAIRRLVQDTAMRLDARPEVDVAESASTSDNGDVIAAVRAVLDHLERDGRATVLRLLVRPAGGDVSIEAHVDVPPRAERPSARVGDLAAAVGEFGATLEVHDGAEEIVVRVAVPAALEGRRTAAAALRGEREWAAALVAALPDPFIVSTEDLRLVEVSDRFVALTGWSRAELLGAPPGELPYWPVEDREAVRAVALGLNDEGAHDVEMTIACRDARRLDVIASAQLVQDPRAERRLQLVTFKDITARRAAERRLRDESALNRAVAGVMREPLFHTREGVVTTVNEAFCQLLGYPAERLVGATRPYFFLPPEGVDEATVYARQLAEVGYAEADLVVVRADGSRILVRARGTVVRGEDGSDLGRVQTAEYLSTVDA